MLLAQIGVICGLWMMAVSDPVTELTRLTLFALLVAFSSATQDISIDAWRIEAAPDAQQGAMAGMYQLGYRLGLILSGGGAFLIAGSFSWSTAYFVMGLAMSVGIITALLVTEPERRITQQTWLQEARVTRFLQDFSHIPEHIRYFFAWIIGAVVCPFTDFFTRKGITIALVILIFIGLFRISDITMGVMAGPFYADMGYTETQVGLVSKTFGVFITIFGALLGGILIMRYGFMRMLIVAAALVTLTNLVFAWLATQEPKTLLLALVISADNLSGGIAGSTFIAYLSSLTSRAYTATQYALFSSLMLLPAKFIGGFSGQIVDSYGYVSFFIYAGLLGVPAVLLAIYMQTKYASIIRPNETEDAHVSTVKRAN